MVYILYFINLLLYYLFWFVEKVEVLFISVIVKFINFYV